MRNIKLGVVLCTIMALLPMTLSAQSATKFNLKAVVLSGNGTPVKGAVVRSEVDEAEAIADSLGTISLLVSLNAELIVSAEGFKTKVRTASPDLQKMVLEPDQLGQQVQVAYRKVEQKDLLGGVSYVNMPEILDKNYITYPLSDMEAFIPGFTGNLWAMGNPLVLIDGVPRGANSVMATEIDQITFLKGISAVALYGSRAANGVIMITTKRGSTGDLTINVRANGGVNTPKIFPEYLGSAEYMTLYNEARLNDGLEPLYSEEDIYHHSAGENPYRYPNVDYYSPEYLQDSYNTYDATVEIAGGGERAKYYTNLGFVTSGSLLDFGEASNIRNERFNIRGNVDMKLNDFITATVDAAVIFQNNRGVNANYWGGAATLRPNRFAPLIPVSYLEENDLESWILVKNSQNLIDGKYLLGGTQQDQTNPIADIYAAGSGSQHARLFQFNTGVDANLKNVLEGLSFQSKFGLNYVTSYASSYNNAYAIYVPQWNNYSGDDLISSFTRIGRDESPGLQNASNAAFEQVLSFSGQFNYQKQVNSVHNLSAILLAGGFQQSISGEYHRIGNANMGLMLGYNFKEKYYIDFNGALIHSAKLPENNRQAFSPTLSLGWRLSEEDFLASSSVVDNLKLSVSGGILHTDLTIPGFFLYDQNYTHNGSYFGWADGSGLPSTESRRGENQELTFSKREEINVGLDASLFGNLLTLGGSAFLSKMNGIVVQNGVLFPNYFATGFPQSSFLPYVNYNNDLRKGIDFNLNLNKQLGLVDWQLGVSGTYYTTEAAKRAEIFEDDYQFRQGKPLDAIFGLESNGFFRDQNDIENSPKQAFGKVRPGDIKYVDQNNDGVVNAQDEVYLGKYGWSGSPFTLGAHLTAKWNNFTFFALGVGSFGAQRMKSNNYFQINGEDKYSAVVRDRWTEATAETATYPRLTTLGTDNNFRNSDFWLYSTNRFNLARVQVSYEFPQSVIGNGFVKGLGIYANGANLLTISPNREILEMSIGAAPQTRSFNLGVKAQF